MYDIVRAINSAIDDDIIIPMVAELKAMANILGILQADAVAFLQGDDQQQGLSADDIEVLIAQRIEAKGSKDYAGADAIRKQLEEQGVILEDSRDGTTWRRE